MDSITPEEGNYIIVYYYNLLNDNEKEALRHHRSTLKLENDDDGTREQMYLKTGWLSEKPEILAYLKNGYEHFTINCTNRVLKDSPGEVFFNLCPNCRKLAKTPWAKQCRFCRYDWH